MNNEHAHLESRHFKGIWEKVICPVKDLVLAECDDAFINNTDLNTVDEQSWRDELESTYRILREACKELCYGDSTGSLDSRKLASIFCKTLIKHKYFKFNLDKAKELLEKEKTNTTKDTSINNWIVANILVNYKLAYLVSLQLIYLTLLDELLATESTVEYGKDLSRIKHLCKYPRMKGFDSFDVNMVICLALADIRGDDFDVLLFSMQLYQIEMYTKLQLINNYLQTN